MGWWSADVMGGDTPLDIQCSIVRELFPDLYEAPEPWDAAEGPLCEGLRSLKPREWWRVLRAAETMTSRDTREIAYQVVGHLAWECGATIPSDLADLVWAAARQDTWAREGDPCRLEAMTALCLSMETIDIVADPDVPEVTL